MEKGTSLPDTQLEVMQVIWDKGGTIMFGELSEELEDRGREWKPNTVLTLLSRLAERGMITAVSYTHLPLIPIRACMRPGMWSMRPVFMLTISIIWSAKQRFTSPQGGATIVCWIRAQETM